MKQAKSESLELTLWSELTVSKNYKSRLDAIVTRLEQEISNVDFKRASFLFLINADVS